MKIKELKLEDVAITILVAVILARVVFIIANA